MSVAGSIASYCSAALNSLTPSQVTFLQTLPKAELHAHLNGSIPINVLQDLAREHISTSDQNDSDVVQSGLENLVQGIDIKEINDFFGLFPAIYALTSTPAALARATRSVLQLFLDGPTPECTYLELRSTPRATPHMTRKEYVEVILGQVDLFNGGADASGTANSKIGEKAALIVSLDRRMDAVVAKECVDIAVSLKKEGRRVVGIDLCGDPMVRFFSLAILLVEILRYCVDRQAGDMEQFASYFRQAKDAGLGVTLHIAEVIPFLSSFNRIVVIPLFQTTANSPSETLQLLSFAPNRLGHATFLDDEAKTIVLRDNICIEICLSSNLLWVQLPFYFCNLRAMDSLGLWHHIFLL